MKTSDSLQDFAYDEIKKRIQNGEYAPGTKLNTQEISDSLGISRSPVLAAINRLIALGLVEATPRRGTTVAKLSDTQIRDIIEARQMMELFCIKLCIRNLDYHPSVLREMEEIVEKFENPAEESYDEAAELDSRFHTLYISLCDNEQIMRLYDSNWSIGTMFYMYSATNLPLTRLEDSFRQHKTILAALKDKDEFALRDIIEKHMSIVYETLEWYSTAIKR